jgi:hypothetical protein
MTMRTHQYTLLGLAALLLPSIATAQIYLGPEDVLYMNAKQTQRLNPRSAEKSVIEREKNITQQQSSVRPTVKDWWDESETESTVSEEVVTPHLSETEPEPTAHPAPNKETDGEGSLHEGASVKGSKDTSDRIQQRLLDRIQQGQYRVVPIELPEVVQYYKDTYLTHSGPESVLVVLAMIPAAYFVIRKARRMEKFVR